MFLSLLPVANHAIWPEVEDAIKNIPGVPGKYPDTFVHKTPDIEVIVNGNGDVVTVIPK